MLQLRLDTVGSRSLPNKSWCAWLAAGLLWICSRLNMHPHPHPLPAFICVESWVEVDFVTADCLVVEFHSGLLLVFRCTMIRSRVHLVGEVPV